MYGKISIIVPVYNSQQFLSRCINSLLNQTYENIEVILINDGSTDNSLQICKELELQDNRVIVMDQKNQGQSVARNVGIDKASGDYISFIDNDDYADVTLYEKLIQNLISTKADIAMCNTMQFYENTDKPIEPYTKISDNQILNNADALKFLFTSTVSPWGKLYKKELFDYAKFPAGIFITEDGRFFVDLFTARDIKLSLIKDYLHYYSINGFNESFAQFKPSYIEAINGGRYYIEKITPYDATIVSPLFTRRLANIYLKTFVKMSILSKEKKKEYEEYISYAKKRLREDYPSLKKDLSLVRKLSLLFIMWFPGLFFIIGNAYGKKSNRLVVNEN